MGDQPDEDDIDGVPLTMPYGLREMEEGSMKNISKERLREIGHGNNNKSSSLLDKQRQGRDEKKKRDQYDTDRVYDEFVNTFDVDNNNNYNQNNNNSNSSRSKFIKTSTVVYNDDIDGVEIKPSLSSNNNSNNMNNNFNTRQSPMRSAFDRDHSSNRPTTPQPTPKSQKGKRSIDELKEEIIMKQERDRRIDYGNRDGGGRGDYFRNQDRNDRYEDDRYDDNRDYRDNNRFNDNRDYRDGGNRGGDRYHDHQRDQRDQRDGGGGGRYSLSGGNNDRDNRYNDQRDRYNDRDQRDGRRGGGDMRRDGNRFNDQRDQRDQRDRYNDNPRDQRDGGGRYSLGGGNNDRDQRDNRYNDYHHNRDGGRDNRYGGRYNDGDRYRDGGRDNRDHRDGGRDNRDHRDGGRDHRGDRESRYHDDRDDGDQNGDVSTYTSLFLRTLPQSVTEDDLREPFSKFGTILTLKIVPPKQANGPLCAIIQYNTHKSADDAKVALDGTPLHGRDLRIVWAKNQSLHNKIAERSMEYLQQHRISVKIPISLEQKEVIDKLAFFVSREGHLFEQEIIKREFNNPMYKFIQDIDSDNYHYYYWKVFSLLTGDQSHIIQPFIDGTMYVPPYDETPKESKPKELERGKEARYHKVREIGSSDRNRFVDMLNNLTVSREKLLWAMGFSIENSEYSHDIVDMIIKSSMSTDNPKLKIPKLYLISDILSNCTVSVQNVSSYRGLFESKLPEYFQNLNETLKSISGRVTALGFKDKVMKVISHWDERSIYSKEYISGLKFTFTSSSSSSGHTSPMKDDYGDGDYSMSFTPSKQRRSKEELEKLCRNSGLVRTNNYEEMEKRYEQYQKFIGEEMKKVPVVSLEEVELQRIEEDVKEYKNRLLLSSKNIDQDTLDQTLNTYRESLIANYTSTTGKRDHHMEPSSHHMGESYKKQKK